MALKLNQKHLNKRTSPRRLWRGQMHVFLTKLRLLLLPFQLFHVEETYQYEFVKRRSNKINVTGGNVFKLDKLVIPVHLRRLHTAEGPLL